MTEKLKMHSPNKVDENIRKIGELFPNCLTERLGANGEPEACIDFDMLKQELSSVVVDGPEERYQFTWPDKKKSILLANAPISATLRPCREESVDFDHTENLYIEGDNLDVLKLLQETYLGKIKMIYIDPPYNTGNDFVYEDDFAESAEDYLANSGQYDAEGNRLVQNTESNGRFHTDWLNMLYPRLKAAKDLLTNDGLIFISIDENEITNLRKICDEIFGPSGFIAQITLLCNPKGRSQDKYIATCHEYVMVYSRSVLSPGSVSIPKTQDEISVDYPLTDEHGAYRELELRNTHRDFGKFNRPKLWYPIYAKRNGTVSLHEEPNSEAIYPLWDDGFEGCWTWGKEKAETELSLLVAKSVNGKKKIYRKAYAYSEDAAPLKQVKSIWNDKSFFTEKGQLVFNSLFNSKGKVFQAPKSVAMIQQCVQMCQSKDSIILDFFSGSATTAHAVMQLNAQDGGNRKFILVQLPEETDEKSEAYKAGLMNICEIGKERIRRAGKKILEDRYVDKATVLHEWDQTTYYDEHKEECDRLGTLPKKEINRLFPPIDVGFRVLKLDSSNMKDVYYNPAEYMPSMFESLADNIKEDRAPEDLLFQVMLDLGVLLSSKIEETTIAGKKVFNVADGFLVACFDADLTDEVITEIAKQKPYYFVTRDHSMASDSVAANFDQIFASYSPDTVRKVL